MCITRAAISDCARSCSAAWNLARGVRRQQDPVRWLICSKELCVARSVRELETAIVDLASQAQVLGGEVILPRTVNPHLSRDLEQICLRCLEKSPELRYHSAGALADVASGSGAMPAPADVARLYCATGTAACDDLDFAQQCDCPGCPVYARVIVKPDKLELTEKIQFAFDKALIEYLSSRQARF